MRTLIKLLILCLPFTMPLMATESPPEQNNWIDDQNDQTDIFAIPLDSSEQEEEIEMKDLDKLQKKHPLDSEPKEN